MRQKSIRAACLLQGEAGQPHGNPHMVWLESSLLCCTTFSEMLSIPGTLCSNERVFAEREEGEKQVRKAARISCRDPGCHLPKRTRSILILKIHVINSLPWCLSYLSIIWLWWESLISDSAFGVSLQYLRAAAGVWSHQLVPCSSCSDGKSNYPSLLPTALL